MKNSIDILIFVHGKIMKILSLIFLLGAISMQNAQSKILRVLHYNIKELDSYKIQHNDPQLAYVQKVMNTKSFDLLSINEVQYDIKNVPSKKFKTTGRNLQKIKKLLNLKHLPFESFHPANTGEMARTKPDGTYYIDPNSPEARTFADQLNFGVMPGQYSTGAMSKYPIVKEVIIKDLLWKEFNPALDLSPFKTAEGESFPDDMKLFDKNFSDITLKIDNKEVHIILLHTVPSYHFGNTKSINMYRNAQQLKFLEWYLTGNTDFKVNLERIKPLKKTDRFLAMGDFNVGFNAENSQGATVLNRLFNKTSPWIKPDKMNFTNESSHFGPNPTRLMLDYIITSKNIKSVQGEIMHPNFERDELGCEDANEAKKDNFKIVEYTSDNKTCRVAIHQDYFHFKKASDHYPLYGEFEI